MSRLKLVLLVVGLSIFGWISWNAYSYFFSLSSPKFHVEGLTANQSYKGDIKCTIDAIDNYKLNKITILVDDKPIVNDFKINKKLLNHNFIIPTHDLSNSKHKLCIILENGTYNRTKTNKEIEFYVDNLPLHADFVKGESSKVFQGRTLHVQIKTNKEIKNATANVFSKQFDCYLESYRSLIYECFIPIDCEELPGEYLLTIEIEDKVGNKLPLETKFEVLKYNFRRSTLKLDAEKVKAENEAGLPESQLESELEEISKKSVNGARPAKKLWVGAFCAPINIKNKQQITTEFGVIRTTQERGLNQHKAVDICDLPKTVVWAPQDGIIALKNRYAHSGNTVVIDHGCGILSLFFHLDSFADISVGQKIKKGNPIGKIGKTGYATGDHLHWEMRIVCKAQEAKEASSEIISNIAVDPMQWIEPSF